MTSQKLGAFASTIIKNFFNDSTSCYRSFVLYCTQSNSASGDIADGDRIGKYVVTS